MRPATRDFLIHDTRLNDEELAPYGMVSEMHVRSFACFGSDHGLRPSIRSVRSRVCGRRAPAAPSRLKVTADGQFEAVLGKPDVRNFRGGGGNVLHGLVAICPEARRGGHTGSQLTSTTARLLSTRR